MRGLGGSGVQLGPNVSFPGNHPKYTKRKKTEGDWDFREASEIFLVYVHIDRSIKMIKLKIGFSKNAIKKEL